MGDSVILNCNIIQGDPDPEIQWYLNDKKIEPAQNDGALMFLERKQTLKVLVARPDHAGHYRCEAKSLAGLDKLSFTVEVWEPPKARFTIFFDKIVKSQLYTNFCF